MNNPGQDHVKVLFYSAKIENAPKAQGLKKSLPGGRAKPILARATK
jgi:hypothetical protein